jgi:ABC-type molybdenum transport system ATPase subunit/photorepair protein PhrA
MDKKAWADTYHAKLVALQSKFTFPPPVALSNHDGTVATIDQQQISLINLENLTFSYNVETGHYIFADPISFNVKLGTRVGVMGPNGAGKSTFLKLLTYKLKATTGTVTQHPHFKLAYFGQHSTAELDLETTPMAFMTDSFPKYNIGQLRQHLGKTGIVGNVADTRIRGLSYSQRSCVIFAKLTLESPHLLILDEPTNFLDLESVDSLIAACNKYRGALLLVSHNRDFLKKCAKQYLSIVPGHFELYDDLKTAEKATYTFITEMEEGGKISGKNVIMENPGGGSVHSSQKVGEKTEAAAAGASTTSSTSASDTAKKPAAPTTTAPAAGAPSGPAAPLTYALNEKIQAKFTEDGRWYNASIKEIKDEKFKVLYLEYGNSEWLAASELRKFNPNPAAAPKKAPAKAATKKAAAPAQRR